MKLKVLIAGGGTGGHLFPGISIAEKILEKRPGSDIRFVGTKRGLENKVISQTSFQLYTLPVRGLYRVGNIKKILSLLRLPLAILKSIFILLSFRPQLVIGVGGYASGPMLLAALFLRKKIILQEQNAYPGMTNRILGKWAGLAFVPFQGVEKVFKNPVVVGNPIREQIRQLSELTDDPREGKPFQLAIFGGSQGARILNQTMVEALPYLTKMKKEICILHQTGNSDHEWVLEAYQKSGVQAEVVPFIEKMEDLYKQSHLVFCRAGSSVNEITAVGRASILVPIKNSSGNHQKKNAEVMQKAGAAIMMEEQGCSAEKLIEILNELLEGPKKLKEMEMNSKGLYQGDASAKIVEKTLEYYRL